MLIHTAKNNIHLSIFFKFPSGISPSKLRMHSSFNSRLFDVFQSTAIIELRRSINNGSISGNLCIFQNIFALDMCQDFRSLTLPPYIEL